MDKHLIGKWYKEELGETLNIFGEKPPRMKMSFSSSGYYNFEPNCVYEDGEELCFEINDEHYRMVYHVHYEDGDDSLCGYYTQFGKKTDVKYGSGAAYHRQKSDRRHNNSRAEQHGTQSI